MVPKLEALMATPKKRCQVAYQALANRPMTPAVLNLFVSLQDDIATAESFNFLIETAPESMSPEKVKGHFEIVKQFVVSHMTACPNANKETVVKTLVTIEKAPLKDVGAYKRILAAVSDLLMYNMMKSNTNTNTEKNKED